ncbi:MAG: hypothetical protein JWP52_4031 [Rhizobacter sp.]|nr:hypothetical protein [Rhizobacter sp.]
MNALITELKTRARLRLNAMRRVNGNEPAVSEQAVRPSPNGRLRDCLNLVARESGFLNWEQARHVLGGAAVRGDDMGTFWHTPRCNGLLNHWFAGYDQAREALAVSDHRVLIPYRRQFIVVDGNYLRELDLDPDDAAWRLAERDLVGAYGSAAWLALSRQRLMASRPDVHPAHARPPQGA